MMSPHTAYSNDVTTYCVLWWCHHILCTLVMSPHTVYSGDVTTCCVLWWCHHMLCTLVTLLWWPAGVVTWLLTGQLSTMPCMCKQW